MKHRNEAKTLTSCPARVPWVAPLAVAPRQTRGELPSLLEYVVGWLDRRSRSKAPGTVANETSRFEVHILPHLGHYRVDQLTREAVIAWQEILTRRVSFNTARGIVGTLRNVYESISVEYGRLLPPGWVNPAQLPPRFRIPPEATNRGKVQFIPLDEAARFLGDPDIPEAHRVLYTLLAYTGVRIGEASAVTWEDYSPAVEPLGELFIHKSYSEGLRLQTKTGADKRIPVHPRLARVLDDWWQHGWERAFGRKPEPEDLIIPRVFRGRIAFMTGGYIRYHWNKNRALLGLDHKRTTPHAWRGSFLSWVESAGGQREIVSRITHPSPKNVVDHYITKTWEGLCKVVLFLEIPEVGDLPRNHAPGGEGEDEVNQEKQDDGHQGGSWRDADGYDREGYDPSGYNRQGYDRQGYGWDGYNREGRDRLGYDREGYDRERDRQGYDRDGRDRRGYGRDGYGRSGRVERP